MLNNLEFASPDWLWLLIPLALLLFLHRGMGASGSIDHPSARFIARLSTKPKSVAGRIGGVCIVLACMALTLSLARPQLVNERSFSTASGIDIMIAFDLSYSMETRDMIVQRQRVQRLIAAKLVINNFIQSRPDDRIGVVGFAGRTKSFCPLTLDHNLCMEIINRFTPELIEADGTAIGSAIAAAASRLNERKDTKSKIIILVTDGANNSGQINPIEAAQAAAKLGIKIYTIAVGTEGGRMSNRINASQEFDEKTLREIAKRTKGEHFRAKDTEMLKNSFQTIDTLEKSEAKRHTIRSVYELFPYMLSLAALMGLLSLALTTFSPRPSP